MDAFIIDRSKGSRLLFLLTSFHVSCRQEQYGGVLSFLRANSSKAQAIMSGHVHITVPLQAPKAAPNKRPRTTQAAAATQSTAYYEQIEIDSDDDDFLDAPMHTASTVGPSSAAAPQAHAHYQQRAANAAATGGKPATAPVADGPVPTPPSGKKKAKIDSRLFEMTLEALVDLRKFLANRRGQKPDNIFNIKALESIAKSFPKYVVVLFDPIQCADFLSYDILIADIA